MLKGDCKKCKYEGDYWSVYSPCPKCGYVLARLG